METQVAPNPQRVMSFAFGFIPSLAVYSAIELNLFAGIAEGKHTLTELAHFCRAPERGLAPLLYTLAGLGLLIQDGERFTLADDVRTFLVPGSPAYLGGVVAHQVKHVAAWAHLPSAIREGKSPSGEIETDKNDGAFFAEFVDSLFNLNWQAAQVVASALPEVSSAIDIGCGSAVWSLALAQQRPAVQVVAVDRLRVLDSVAKAFVERFGCADRYLYRAGNFRNVDLGKSDVAFLGHILHSEGREASRTLLRRVRDGLNPGGVLVIAEMVAAEPRSADVFSNLFDLNMLMWTKDGTVFSRSELESMGREAGFVRFEWVDAPSPSPILLAYRD